MIRTACYSPHPTLRLMLIEEHADPLTHWVVCATIRDIDSLQRWLEEMRQTHAISSFSLHRYEGAIYAWLTTEPLTPERLRSPLQAADVLRHAARTHTQRLAGLKHGA